MAPKVHHWLLLSVCALVAIVVGVLDIVGGASAKSPGFAMDDRIVRTLGVGLVVFSGLVFLRRNWAFVGLILLFLASALEVVVTMLLSGRITGNRSWAVLLVITLVFFGMPAVLLLWIRKAFVRPGSVVKPDLPR